MKERWKDIKGYEGLYQISNLGKVRSLTFRKCCHGRYITTQRPKPLELVQKKCKTSYYKIHLTKDKIRKSYFVHRLVAEAFVIGKTKNKNIVNHKDFNKDNNNANNLEWTTQRQNTIYSIANMKKRHNSKTATGERYITYNSPRKNKTMPYRVTIKKKNNQREYYAYKNFKTLNEAIKYRNQYYGDTL